MGREVLRKYSLDELPQIGDIFRGKMSIIGPRPALWNQDDLVAERDKYGANDILCDFVFNLAGVNRPKETSEFMEGNYGFASVLLSTLKVQGNTSPVMLASSSQASLAGRFQDSDYGKSKLVGEELFFRYAEETGAKVLVYRFPNLFGKWCKPNYNSAVATFCNAVANDLEYTVNDPETEPELLYIDDLIEEMLDALEGKEHHCNYPKDDAHNGLDAVAMSDGKYCYVPVTYHVTLGEIVGYLNTFKQMQG